MPRMSSRSYAARLTALEQAEQQRQVVDAGEEYRRLVEERGRRLAALGFTSGDSDTSCPCCCWRMPLVFRYQRSSEPQQPCYICGANLPSGADYDRPARYACPRCAHAYAGERRGLTPCPRCAFVPPPALNPYHDDGEEVHAYVVAVVASLARAYGPAVAAAWADMDEPALAEELADVTAWWYRQVPRDLLTGLRRIVADGEVVVACARYGDGRPAVERISPQHLHTTNRCAAEATPEEFAADHALLSDARHLERLLAGWRQVTEQPVIIDAAGVLAALDAMLARSAAVAAPAVA